jgi:hypothetical protein
MYTHAETLWTSFVARKSIFRLHECKSRVFVFQRGYAFLAYTNLEAPSGKTHETRSNQALSLGQPLTCAKRGNACAREQA